MGGGLAVVIGDASVEFEVISPTFSGNDAWRGKDVFVSSSNLTRSVTLTTLPFLPTTNPPIHVDLMAFVGRDMNVGGIVVPRV